MSVPRSPHVTNIRFVFFIAAAVGVLHRDETVPFIKPLCRTVDLERPQLQTIGVALLRQPDELITNTLATPQWIKVKLTDKPLIKDQHPDHGTVSNGHPGLTSGYRHVADIRPDLLIGVAWADSRQSHREGAKPHVGYGAGVRGDRSADDEIVDAQSRARWQMNNIGAFRFRNQERMPPTCPFSGSPAVTPVISRRALADQGLLASTMITARSSKLGP